MPYLMINLDDIGDCQRGLRQLQGRIRRAGQVNECSTDPVQGADGTKTPLKQKLKRVKQRGVWRFVSQIALLDSAPRSLPELDEALDLPRNKMRSTKAIFAKLENRMDIRFLKPDPEGSEDASGNPRYIMPPRMRKVVRELVD